MAGEAIHALDTSNPIPEAKTTKIKLGKAPLLFFFLSLSSAGWTQASANYVSSLLENEVLWRPIGFGVFASAALLFSRLSFVRKAIQRSLWFSLFSTLAILPCAPLLYFSFAKFPNAIASVFIFLLALGGISFVTTALFINDHFRWNEHEGLSLFIPSLLGAVVGLAFSEKFCSTHSAFVSIPLFACFEAFALFLAEFLFRDREQKKYYFAIASKLVLLFVCLLFLLQSPQIEHHMELIYFGIQKNL